MRILITGGAGFIGSHLAERLLGQGHEVTVLDRKNRHEWPETKRVKTYAVDCRDIAVIPRSLCAFDKFDFVYHLAATVGVRKVLEDPAECISNNIDSLRAVLSLGIPGVFASTSEVYGRTESVLGEDAPILYSAKSRWSYAASKLIGEWLAKQAGWKSVRFFNVVGPRQSTDYGAVLPKFVGQALEGKPLTVYGDGSQVRTFLDVRDCAEILDRLRDKEFDVVNVGGPHTMAIRDLAIKVWETVVGDWPIMLASEEYSAVYPEGFEECPSRVPDLSKLESLIGEFEYRKFEQTILDLAEALRPQEVIHEH